ncbi:phage tail tape measure protein [Polycladidibacter hongkongensis]|uniref:phage tail tape measure protein n=1 Tax=Polycladidibacter hongkongensis TaxID=1647556 RepID=UPI000834DC8C|nr:phage tail tape measure protein [Pseudovibrio hongkongensis]
MSRTTVETSLSVKAINQLSAPLKKMAGDTSKFAQAAKNDLAKLERLRGPVRLIEDFRGAEHASKSAQAKFQRLRDRVRTLKTEIKATENPTKAMRRALDSARKAAEKANRQWRETTGAVKEKRRAMDKAGIATRKLAEEEERLTRELRGSKSALDSNWRAYKTHLQQRERAMERHRQFQERMQRGMAKVGAGVAAGYGVARAGGYAWRKITSEAQYKQDLTRFGIKAEIADEGAKDKQGNRKIGVDDFDARINAVARTYAMDRFEIARAAFTAAEAGMSADDIFAALPTWGKMGQVSLAEQTDLVNLTDSHLRHLGISKDNLDKALQIQYAIGNAGKFEMDAMAKYGATIGANMKAFGWTGMDAVAGMSAALQVSRNATGDDSTAANNMSNFFSALGQRETKERFSKAGISIEDEWKAAIAAGADPLLHMVEVIRDHTGGDQFRMAELLGDRQARDFAVAMAQQLEDYLGYKGVADKSEGVVTRDLARILHTPAADLARAAQSLERITGNVAGSLQGAAAGAARSTQGTLDKVEDFTAQNPGTTAAIAGAAAAGTTVVGGWSAYKMFSGAREMLKGLRGLGVRGAVSGSTGTGVATGAATGSALGRAAGWSGRLVGRFAGPIGLGLLGYETIEYLRGLRGEKSQEQVDGELKALMRTPSATASGKTAADDGLAELRGLLADVERQIAQINPNGPLASTLLRPLEAERDALAADIAEIERDIERFSREIGRAADAAQNAAAGFNRAGGSAGAGNDAGAGASGPQAPLQPMSYQPTIHIQGGGNPEEIAQAVRTAIDDSYALMRDRAYHNRTFA